MLCALPSIGKPWASLALLIALMTPLRRPFGSEVAGRRFRCAVERIFYLFLEHLLFVLFVYFDSSPVVYLWLFTLAFYAVIVARNTA